MKQAIYFILIMLIGISGYSQPIPPDFPINECGLKDTTSGSDKLSGLNCARTSPLQWDLDWFKPNVTTPVKYVRLNFVFLQKNDGTGGFQQNDPVQQQYWTDIIQALNDKMANLVQPVNFCSQHPPSNCISNDFISNTKIQFIVNQIYVQDSYGWDNTGTWGIYTCPNNSTWYLNYLDAQIIADPQYEPAINIFFTEEGNFYNDMVINGNCSATPALNVNCSMFPTNDISAPMKVHMRNAYTNYRFANDCAPAIYGYPYDPVIRSWGVNGTAGSLAHELGHSFNLTHCNSCQTGPANEHIMNQCGTCPRNYLATQNLGNMHRSLATTNMRRYVDNCTPTNNLEILSPTFIDFDMKIYRNIRMYYGGDLTIDCRLTMLENPTIDIFPGGSLTFDDDAELDIDCNGCLGGTIEVDGTLNINSPNIYLPENWTINVGSTGVVNVNLPTGFCTNPGTQINIDPGGQFFINGQNYTSTIANGYNNIYDKLISNQPLSGSHYAYNEIEVSGTVNTIPGIATEVVAGRKIVFKPTFAGYNGLLAYIDPLINNCGETPCVNNPHSVKSDAPVMVEENQSAPQINIFPNPNNGQFSIALDHVSGKTAVQVFDLMGKVVWSSNNVQNKAIVNIGEQPKGVYLVRITIGEEVLHKKIVYQ